MVVECSYHCNVLKEWIKHKVNFTAIEENADKAIEAAKRYFHHKYSSVVVTSIYSEDLA